MSVRTCFQCPLVRAAVFFLLFSFVSFSSAEAEDGMMKELTEMSIEELMRIEVISVSKKEERLSDAASAVYVITSEEIRRSGATTIAEVLRGAPGIQVNRIDSNLWAISARGFNERYANKLLVMIDGRSVYSPVFSGVYWDVQDTSLEDIDRIEVIRGPGGTIWGANAVNGIINIITKDAADSQGWLFSLTGGTEDRFITNIRYGGKTGANTYYRFFVKYSNRDGFIDTEGHENPDNWYVYRAGFRVDSELTGRDTLMIQGDVYDGNVSSRELIPVLRAPYLVDSGIDENINGRDLLVRWKRRTDSIGELTAQFYYDHVKRFQRFDIPGMQERYDIDTFDLDFSHHFVLLDRHDITWGGGIRYITDSILNNSPVRFSPDKRHQYILNIFIQDEIEVLPGSLYLTAGTKIEHNDYTGYEFEPSVRLRWHPSEGQTFWAAVSRAVRTPSRIEIDGRIDQAVLPGTPPVMFSLIARDDFISEELYAYEAGYRINPVSNLSLDIAAFYNRYDDLRTFEPGEIFQEEEPVPHIVYSFNGQNRMYGESYGLELSARWEPLKWWRLVFNYTFLDIDLHRDSGSIDEESERLEDENPENQISVFSYMDLTDKTELDVAVHYVDGLPAYDIGDYFVVNLRLGYRPMKNFEVSLATQNLFDSHHPEIGSKYVSSATVEIERGVYGKVTWRF